MITTNRRTGAAAAVVLALAVAACGGAKAPPEFWKALPYLATLVALSGFLGRNRPPSGLGKP